MKTYFDKMNEGKTNLKSKAVNDVLNIISMLKQNYFRKGYKFNFEQYLKHDFMVAVRDLFGQLVDSYKAKWDDNNNQILINLVDAILELKGIDEDDYNEFLFIINKFFDDKKEMDKIIDTCFMQLIDSVIQMAKDRGII